MPAPDLAIPEDLNIAAALARRARDGGWLPRPAFRTGEATTTYEDVLDAAGRWGGVLAELDVRPEERVVIALPDTPSFPVTFLGTMWAGAVAVPVNPYLDDDAYPFYLADSRAVVAVVPPWLVPAVSGAASGLPRLRHVVVFPGGSGDAGAGAEAAAPDPGGLPGGAGIRAHRGPDLLAAADPAPPVPTHRDEPAFWLYTSGSTGPPKGAVHLHHDIWVAAECWGRATLDLDGGAVHLSASKLYFAYGLGNSLHCPMWTGGRTVLEPDKPAPAMMLDAISREGVTHFYAVPSFYNAMLAEPGLDGRLAAGDLDSLRLCVSAGEPLPEPVCRRWMERTGVPVLDGLGSTELLHIFISNRPDDVRPGSSGRPVPGYEARVVADDGREAEADEIGDLWVRGDSACAGYWNRHEATKRAIKGHWFVTGDKYRRDADGYYWYAGRADDMFKVHGQWVSPTRVESAFLEHPEVHDVAVVSGTDDDGLACGVAHVVTADPAAADEALARRLRQHVGDLLPRYCVPARVVFAADLPRTATGKVRRFKLREGVG